ncbi:uncharacterized protein PgNI_08034 [Pyricularia grisea]|uniref:Uncharacterized protein n=1 Tax=Pyricularia grisea TaxID=148305 RepID=A0A6P8AW07_PYRGI|nr:uncharacterized protein PgNI_08034 [Pyricularia grisea]TLD06349.1 hypothetical protein PgNI_08034 [Pyricularia grisea]
MTGLLQSWTIIWAAVLLLHYSPVPDARRRRCTEVPQDDGEYEEGGLIWQRYPQRDFVARLAWTSDLLISFRAVGWQVAVGVAWLALFRNILMFQTVLKIAERLEKGLFGLQLQVVNTVSWIATSVP